MKHEYLPDACLAVDRGLNPMDLPSDSPERIETTSSTAARTGCDHHCSEICLDMGRDQPCAGAKVDLAGPNMGSALRDQLLARLGACTVTTLRRYAERNHWPLEYLHVYLRYYSDAGGARIDRRLSIGGLAEWQKSRFAEIAERTPVSLALSANLHIHTTLV